MKGQGLVEVHVDALKLEVGVTVVGARGVDAVLVADHLQYILIRNEFREASQGTGDWGDRGEERHVGEPGNNLGRGQNIRRGATIGRITAVNRS